jgi:hypothetical protein
MSRSLEPIKISLSCFLSRKKIVIVARANQNLSFFLSRKKRKLDRDRLLRLPQFWFARMHAAGRRPSTKDGKTDVTFPLPKSRYMLPGIGSLLFRLAWFPSFLGPSRLEGMGGSRKRKGTHIHKSRRRSWGSNPNSADAGGGVWHGTLGGVGEERWIPGLSK